MVIRIQPIWDLRRALTKFYNVLMDHRSRLELQPAAKEFQEALERFHRFAIEPYGEVHGAVTPESPLALEPDERVEAERAGRTREDILLFLESAWALGKAGLEYTRLVMIIPEPDPKPDPEREVRGPNEVDARYPAGNSINSADRALIRVLELLKIFEQSSAVVSTAS